LILLPWLQTLIGRSGWRAAVLGRWASSSCSPVPLNLLLRRPAPGHWASSPTAIAPRSPARWRARQRGGHGWAAVDWTLGRAARTARFWWIAIGYFCGLFAWYAVQVHQTKYLTEIGFNRATRRGRSAS